MRNRRRLFLLLIFGVLPGPSCSCGDPDNLEDVEVIARLSDEVMDFGLVGIGGEGAKSVFVYNDGNARMELDGAITIDDASGIFEVIDRGAFPVSAQGFTAISVRFRPNAAGIFTTTLRLPIAAPGSPVELPVRGEGEPADVGLAPALLDFGELEAGLTSTMNLRAINLTNTAVQTSIAIEGNGFLIDGSSRFSIELGPNEEQEFEVTFSPDRGGAFTAVARAETCGVGCGPSTMLSGTGLAPRLDIQPRPIAFGEVGIGATNTIEIKLRNQGIGNLQIQNVEINDPEGALQLGNAPVLPAVLSGEDEMSFFLTYIPTAPDGEFSATVVVTSSDPLQGRVSIPVTASTPGAALRLLPAAANFGLLDPGQSRMIELVAISVGTVPVSISALGVTGSAFAFDGPPPVLPIELAPTQSILLPVVATANTTSVAAGGAEGELTIGTFEETLTSNLAFTSGVEGCQPRAVVANLDLGFLRVGDGSSGALVVENIGTSVCTSGNASPATGLPFDPGFSWQIVDAADLEPGETGQVLVAYTASGPGQARAFFELSYAEREAPLLLSSTATGRLGTLTPQPSGIGFGPSVVGCAGVSRGVAFINDGATDISIEEVGLTIATDEVTLTAPNVPVVVPPGTVFSVSLRSENVSAGLHTTQVEVNTLEVGSVQAWVTSDVSAEGATIDETFFVPEGEIAAVDVLFIVDNSGSMFDDQQLLAENFAAFIASASSPGSSSDFHLGVTSTDVLSDGALRGRLVSSPTYLTPFTPLMEETFSSHVALGVEGSGLELGLEAMRLALDLPLASGFNAGFHRPEAALSVIIISDEDDGGDQAFAAPENSRSVESYVEFLSAVKGGVLTETPILFSAVVEPTLSTRYNDMVDAFGGVTLDISQPDWGTQLGQIGNATFGIRARFRLANASRVEDVEVTVDGVPTTSFTLDARGQTLLLDVPPQAGAVVVVTYVPDC